MIIILLKKERDIVLESLYSNFKSIFMMTWPVVFISMIVLISLRLSYLYRNNIKVVLYKEIMLFFFAFYVLCLFQIVTSTDTSVSGGSNFIPFKEIMRYEFLSRLFIKNVIGNVLLFIPYGYFVGKYFVGKSKLLTFFLVLLASIAIECTQLSIGRVFDVDDIILNVIGGMLGYLLYRLLEKVYNSLPKVLKSNWFLNIIFIALFITLVVFLVILFL